jgi:hypothetical protein
VRRPIRLPAQSLACGLEVYALDLLQEGDYIVARIAREAVAELLGRDYVEGGVLIVVKRAKADMLAAPLLELYVPTDNIDDI